MTWRVRLISRLLLVAVVGCLLAFDAQAVEGKDSLPGLLYDATRYANTPGRKEAKRLAREELKQQLPAALREAMAYVHGDNVGLQVLVMEWVQSGPAETVVPTLLEFAGHERPETRRMALYLLGFHDTPEHAGEVLPHLEDPVTRGSALRTLGKWKIQAARPAAEKWLVDGEERLRVVAANALRDLAEPGAIPALIQALDDPVFTVRNTAARALLSFGSEAVKPIEAARTSAAPRTGRILDRCLIDLGAAAEDSRLPSGIAPPKEGYFRP